MKQTVLQELIKWTLENAFSVTAEDGTSIIAIDHEEMRDKFNEWLKKEEEQMIDYASKMQMIKDVDFDGNVEFCFDPKKSFSQMFSSVA
jgi:hypothetical protein